MKQNQNLNLIKTSSRTSSMANFLHFFNLKMFRYSLLKQLKAASSYVFVVLMIVATFGSLIILFLMKNEGNTMVAKNTVVVFKYVFFLIYFPFFTMLIVFKSVQMIRWNFINF